MFASSLHHAFGVQGCPRVCTQFRRGVIRFRVRQRRAELRCDQCGCRRVILRGKAPREFRSVPIGRHRVWIVLAAQRVECRACHGAQQVTVPFADRRRS